MPRISLLLDQIDSGMLLLPEFQRGYVWSRDQVRRLMRSLYLGYPIGGLLLWEVNGNRLAVRGPEAGGMRLVLLDGQQRATTLYGVVRGRPPRFFDEDPLTFTGLHFHLEDEKFQFFSHSQRHEDSLWVDVSRLYAEGVGAYFDQVRLHGERAATYVNRLNRLLQATERDLPAETITGPGYPLGVVVDIFNQVNSGGTKLSKGDLALAKLCAQSQDARRVIRQHLNRWRHQGFKFSHDLLLRCITAATTGRAVLSALETVGAERFERAMATTPGHLDTFLGAAAETIGLDHDRVLLGRSALPVITRLLELSGGRFADDAERNKVVYWYLQATLQDRYARSTETILTRDLATLDRDGVDGLIAELRQEHDNALTVGSDDFEGANVGSRAYALAYLLARTRTTEARDTAPGRVSSTGDDARLEAHDIFPKSRLRAIGFPSDHINAVANLCFVNGETRQRLHGRAPDEYLLELEEQVPGILAAQAIPDDTNLWRTSKYPDFIQARRELLARAFQQLLDDLLTPAPSELDSEPAPEVLRVG